MESDLIRAAQAGEARAFGDLVRLYNRRAYAAAYTYMGNREDALEMAQDSFLKAFKAMRRFDPKMPFYPWLYRIIKNTCLNQLKKKRRRGEQSLDAMMETGYDAKDAQPNPRGHSENNDLKAAMAQAMTHLTEEHREIIRLRHFLEMSYSEIAVSLEIPQGTVMSRLHAARKSLRDILEKNPPEAVNIS